MQTTAIIIGAGHAGLAMSRYLAARSIDHVVLERGEVANSWRTERWDSLRLLTPNWQSRLPGYCEARHDPDGFRTMSETVRFIERYAAHISAPIVTRTRVESVQACGAGYKVLSNQGEWRCQAIVLATGACNVANVPALANAVPKHIRQLTTMQYRNPGQVGQGGVLVVGASASGVQIADELCRAGRRVTLAVGEHVRVPRTYRGKDIQWWMDISGLLDERYDQVDDLERVRNVASLQLIGSAQWRNIDLNALSSIGVRPVGRLAGIRDAKAQFSGALRNHCALADLKLGRLLDTIDQFTASNALDALVEPAHRFKPTQVDGSPPLALDLRSGEIDTIVWATGYRPDYSWLDVPVFDRKGRVRHDGGVVDAPGMYLMGLPFMRRRKSSLIDGAAADARELSAHLAAFLDQGARRRTQRCAAAA